MSSHTPKSIWFSETHIRAQLPKNYSLSEKFILFYSLISNACRIFFGKLFGCLGASSAADHAKLKLNELASSPFCWREGSLFMTIQVRIRLSGLVNSVCLL